MDSAEPDLYAQAYGVLQGRCSRCGVTFARDFEVPHRNVVVNVAVEEITLLVLCERCQPGKSVWKAQYRRR